MAFNPIVVGLLVVAACFIIRVDAAGNLLNLNAITVTKDAKDREMSETNVTLIALDFNKTRDSDMLNKFVKNQIIKIQKNPELMLTKSDSYGPMPSYLKPKPPMDYKWFQVNMQSNFRTHNSTRLNNVFLRVECRTRRGGFQEALYALSAPTI